MTGARSFQPDHTTMPSPLRDIGTIASDLRFSSLSSESREQWAHDWRPVRRGNQSTLASALEERTNPSMITNDKDTVNTQGGAASEQFCLWDNTMDGIPPGQDAHQAYATMRKPAHGEDTPLGHLIPEPYDGVSSFFNQQRTTLPSHDEAVSFRKSIRPTLDRLSNEVVSVYEALRGWLWRGPQGPSFDDNTTGDDDRSTGIRFGNCYRQVHDATTWREQDSHPEGVSPFLRRETHDGSG